MPVLLMTAKGDNSDYVSRLATIQSLFQPREFRLEKPDSEFPELFVHIPDEWPHIQLAPLYDVHMGHELHASTTFLRHRDWLVNEPYVLSWNGGDMWENAILGSPGIFSQRGIPHEQIDAAVEQTAPLQHKMIFALPGNHEARTFRQTGFDIARVFADALNLPYFPDYCFCTIKWRGQNFRVCAHHGTGAAQTPGGQRNAARKDMPWVKTDLYWTGHLHQPIVDLAYQADFDQRTGRMDTRQALVIVSPSYLRYFGGYAAAKRMAPGAIGLTPVILRDDGRIDASIHAKGNRR